MKPRIAAITGKLDDTVISMNEGPVLIGRQAGATLKIGNASVSRRHAMIERDGDRFIIADLGSRNGTFVNGQRVTGDTLLREGDVIGFGANGPALEFAVIETDVDLPVTTGAEGLAELRRKKEFGKPIEIGADVWVGGGAIIWKWCEERRVEVFVERAAVAAYEINS